MNRPEILVIGSGVMGRGIAKGFAAAGHPGIKTGKGFHDWSGTDPDQVKAEAARKLAGLLAYLKRQA